MHTWSIWASNTVFTIFDMLIIYIMSIYTIQCWLYGVLKVKSTESPGRIKLAYQQPIHHPVSSQSNDHSERCVFSTGWWFGTFSIFPHIENHHPNWLIFFGGVETTNQILKDVFFQTFLGPLIIVSQITQIFIYNID